MFLTTIEREKQEMLEQGIEQGILEVAQRMLGQGFTPEMIVKVTGLPLAVVQTLTPTTDRPR